jgi:hypothetical protein
VASQGGKDEVLRVYGPLHLPIPFFPLVGLVFVLFLLVLTIPLAAFPRALVVAATLPVIGALCAAGYRSVSVPQLTVVDGVISFRSNRDQREIAASEVVEIQADTCLRLRLASEETLTVDGLDAERYELARRRNRPTYPQRVATDLRSYLAEHHGSEVHVESAAIPAATRSGARVAMLGVAAVWAVIIVREFLR